RCANANVRVHPSRSASARELNEDLLERQARILSESRHQGLSARAQRRPPRAPSAHTQRIAASGPQRASSTKTSSSAKRAYSANRGTRASARELNEDLLERRLLHLTITHQHGALVQPPQDLGQSLFRRVHRAPDTLSEI